MRSDSPHNRTPARRDAAVSAPTGVGAWSLASRWVIGWLVACGVIANIAALSPLANHASDISNRIHDTQHGVIFAASIVVGAGLRDFMRARPWSLRLRLILGGLGLAGGIASFLPALDALRQSMVLHNTEHAILVLAGASMGVVLRDAVIAHGANENRRRAAAGFRRTRLIADYAPEVYQPTKLDEWIAIGKRQDAKDRVILPRLATEFVPGRVLELGAGAGQTTLILRQLGWDVVASDFAPFFVDYLESLGLEAHQVDATDIGAAGLGAFPNIFCQSITPLITADVDVIARSYRSIYDALEPGGRLVAIHAQAARHELRATMALHLEQARLAGFDDVKVVRNQVLPAVAYRGALAPFAAFAEVMLGRYFGDRFVLIADRAKQRGGNAGSPRGLRFYLRAPSSRRVRIAPC